MASELVPITAMALPVMIVGTVLGTKYLNRRREMAHQERMRAIEMGLSPDRGGEIGKAIVCTGICAGVPIGSLFCAWLSSVTAVRIADEAWVAATVVSLVAIVAGSRLARTLFSRPSPEAPPQANPHQPATHHKPEFDPDAYDVVGRRG